MRLLCAREIYRQQFANLLIEMYSERGDLFYNSERQLFSSHVLMKAFYVLIKEIIMFFGNDVRKY